LRLGIIQVNTFEKGVSGISLLVVGVKKRRVNFVMLKYVYLGQVVVDDFLVVVYVV
jgi:hypothetical protein